MGGSVTLSLCIISLLSVLSGLDAQTAVCCNFNSDLQDTWYTGYGDPENGVIPYFNNVVQNCQYDILEVPESPYNTTTIGQVSWKCGEAVETISGSYFTTEFVEVGIIFGYGCASYSLNAAKDVRLFRRKDQTDTTLTPGNCSQILESETKFRVDLKLPLTATGQCPWDRTDYGTWQTSLGGNSSACDGVQTSVTTLQSDYMEMTMCQDSNNAAGIAESSTVRLRCLRKWQGSEMASLGNDSLGTFFLVAVDNAADLAAGTSAYYVARYLKRATGDYVIGVNWTTPSSQAGAYADATMNPETADTLTNGRVYQLKQPSQCCDYPSALVGDWYVGRSQVLAVGPNAGKREFYTDEVYSCTLDERIAYDTPATTGSSLPFPCFVAGKELNGSFVITQFLNGQAFLPRCLKYRLSPSNNIRFTQILPGGGIGRFTASTQPEECNSALESLTEYRATIRLPLDDGTSTCPWAGESHKKYQAYVKQSDGSTPCTGDSASVFELAEKTFKINICQNTNTPAASPPNGPGIFENKDTEFKCLRTWTDADVSPLGNDTHGTYFLMAQNDPTTLAAGTLPLFVAKYLKKADGTFVISIDWRNPEPPFGHILTVNTDPETAYIGNTRARVYVLSDLPDPSSSDPVSSSQTMDSSIAPSATAETSSHDIASTTATMDQSTTVSMDPSATASMDPSATASMDPFATASMDSSATASMDPSASASMDPSATGSMDPSATASMDPSASASMDPSATGSMDQSATGSMDPSATGSIDPSATGSIDPSASGSMNPSASGSIDPSATGSMDPSASASMDSSATGSMDPSASASMDPSATASMDPSATVDQSTMSSTGLESGGSDIMTASGTDSMMASLTDSMMASLTDSMMASGTDSMMASGTDSMMASGTDSMIASGTDSMMASGTDSMIASGTDSMIASGTDSMMASGTDSIIASGTDSMMASGTDSMMAYGTDSMMASGTDSMIASGTDSMMASMSGSMLTTGTDASTAMDSFSLSTTVDPSTSGEQNPTATGTVASTTGAISPSGAGTQGSTVDGTSGDTQPSQTIDGSSDATAAPSPTDGASSSAAAVDPTPTSAVPQATATTVTAAPETTSEAQTTPQAPKPARDYTKDIGEGDIHTNADFDAVTGGNPAQYCASIEDEIAQAAGVSPQRVDATCTKDENGKLDVKAQIFNTDDPNDIPFEQALLNLERAQDQGTLTLPSATVDAAAYERYILKPDGTRICLGDTCEPGSQKPEASSGDDSTFDETLVYSIIGIGAFIILITIILVIFCVYSQKEPDVSQQPLAQEEGFGGMAKHWQADYVNTLKADMKGGHF